MLLHESRAIAQFDSEKKAKIFLRKILKEKEWIHQSGLYHIVEVKEVIRVD